MLRKWLMVLLSTTMLLPSPKEVNHEPFLLTEVDTKGMETNKLEDGVICNSNYNTVINKIEERKMFNEIVEKRLKLIEEIKQKEKETEEEIPTVQIGVAEWDELIASVNRLEEVSVELKAQKAAFAAEAGKYAEQITRAIQAQNEATAAAIRKISEEASEQVGKASEKASKVICRRSIRDDALWWLRMAYAAIPMLLTLLLWAYVGLKT